MKRFATLIGALAVALTINAQGNNTGMGGNDGDYESLAERVLKLEKKSDALNIYFNYAASFQEGLDPSTSAFKNKQARIEIKGNLTDKLSYRFRHRLNKMNAAQGQDNFAKATDILMVGYQFDDVIGIQGGKMCQNWGGFEFDENPMYIYQYSDMVDYMDNFMAGVNLSIKPVPTQEFAVNITNAYNNKLPQEYGDNLVAVSGDGKVDKVKASNHPLTYIALWSGSFLGDKLQTRWSYGLQNQAEGYKSTMLILGQKLNLPKFQWYFDYMGAFDDLDRLGIATDDAMGMMNVAGNARFANVKYNSFITKANWQFAPQWNLMLKGTYETASVDKNEALKNYRKSIGYIASVEYYPVQSQDFRLFAAFIGHKYNYSDKCALADNSTARVELGFMYRIKAF